MRGNRRSAEPGSDSDGAGPLRVGLCWRCHFGRSHAGRSGNRFWRCARSDADDRYPRYPRLPVRECRGFEPDEP